ncbi:hypothetical protein HJG60_009468 [Phyllostomus discolor]|uniref:Uncharacterized protein n=1 Tax=Phyllostomus discolor TaxID=89673 RepID=A0A834D8Y5_9CHIR|nr:hypothetical protein HJG60_009468 [Phyllostomus discolor]
MRLSSGKRETNANISDTVCWSVTYGSPNVLTVFLLPTFVPPRASHSSKMCITFPVLFQRFFNDFFLTDYFQEMFMIRPKYTVHHHFKTLSGLEDHPVQRCRLDPYPPTPPPIPVRAHVWVVCSIPSQGTCRRQSIDVSLLHRYFSLSLSPSLPFSLKKKKKINEHIFLKEKCFI